ncbi:MAG: Rne/Rng family ribonuclease [Thermosulfidibacteraceae bacterium]|jgi:ribonuclease G
MGNRILITSTKDKYRCAVIENDLLVEFYEEDRSANAIVGNIYKGRVLKLLPGMDAAFVNIGLGRSGFLYIQEVFPFDLFEDFTEDEEDINLRKNLKKIPITDILQEGQEIIVQVAKEPIGSKGPRLTSHITIPGRYLVLMPTMTHIGISRKIENKEERKRLKEIAERVRTGNYGVIVRTVSENKSEEELKQDMEYLLKLWNFIKEKAEKVSAPTLLYSDLKLPLRAVRDFYNEDTEELVVDDEKEYKAMVEFAQNYIPKAKEKIKLYTEKIPLFAKYNLDEEIKKALEKKVWLKSGGYIVIEETEALTAIDVNTGRYVGRSNLEETIFKTNMEAAREIAHQIRLRNLGGIVIIDFIDMKEEDHKEAVLATLKENLKRDRYPSTIIGFNELGLLILTRKRTKESLKKTLCEPCSYCKGDGYIENPRSIADRIFTEIRKTIAQKPTIKVILVEANPSVVKYMVEEKTEEIEEIEKKFNVKLRIIEVSNLHQEQFKVKGFVS